MPLHYTSPRGLCVGGITVGCHSAHSTTHKVAFDHICGQTKSYLKGTSDTLNFMQFINESYVDRKSKTAGPPHHHMWTYAVTANDGRNYGNSNYNIHVPHTGRPTTKDNYYSESKTSVGVVSTISFLSDVLRDGDGCSENSGCCSSLGMP